MNASTRTGAIVDTALAVINGEMFSGIDSMADREKPGVYVGVTECGNVSTDMGTALTGTLIAADASGIDCASDGEFLSAADAMTAIATKLANAIRRTRTMLPDPLSSCREFALIS